MALGSGSDSSSGSNSNNSNSEQQKQLNSGGSPPSPPPPPPNRVTTNINAIEVVYQLTDGSQKTYYFYAKQDLPPVNTSSSPVPIQGDIFYVVNDLARNAVNTVTINGTTQIQPPAIKSVTKADTTSTVSIDLPNPSAVSVYFGFFNRAGIVNYDIFEKDTTNYFIQSGQVDLHSSSDAVIVAIKGVEVASGLDETKTYTLRMKHTGTANPQIFDSGQDHKIYVGDVVIHRNADASQSILEYVSNTQFANSSFLDDGRQNSITGRTNFVEFFDVQRVVADGETAVFPVNAATVNVRSVEIDNGRGFKTLNQFIDWTTELSDGETTYRQNVVLSFVPKQGAVVRITYDVFSYGLQRKIELSQPKTFDGRYDRYVNIYAQNEATYIEINANPDTSV